MAWQRTAVIHNDGPVFLGLARLLREGQLGPALAHPFHPGYPAAVAGLAPLFGGEEAAAAAVSVGAGAVAVACLYAFLRASMGPAIAWLGALILCVHPYAVAYSSDVQSDGLYAALFLAAVALLWQALERGGAGFAAAAGAASALAYLTRPEGLGVALAGLGAVLLRAARGHWRPRRAGALALALAAALACLAGPYLLQLRAQSGQWALSQKKAVAELGGGEARRARAGPVALDRELLSRSPFLDTVVRGPRYGEGALPDGPPPLRLPGPRGPAAAAEVLSAFWSALRPELFGLALLGLWARRRGRELPFVLGLAALYAVVLFGLAFGAGYVNRRHALPPALLFLGYAAAGIPVFGRGALRALGREVGGAGQARWAVALGLALVVGFAVPKLAPARRLDRLAERRAAEWLRGREPGAPVAARKQRVAYYADAPFVPMPSTADATVLAYLRSAGARYVIVDDRELDESGALRGAAREGMRMVHRSEAGGGAAVVLAVEPVGS